MNLYFLVEGHRTEKKVYPKWLSYLIPDLAEVQDPFKIKNNNYYLFTGNGFPSLLDNYLRNAIEDINQIGKFDYLVICLDSDEYTLESRKKEVFDFVRKNKLELNDCHLVVVVQQKCIETWFLGNRNVYSNHPQSDDLLNYNKFYNVRDNDPELMTKLKDFNTCAQFHEVYLSEMLLEKNIKYSKKNPNGVVEKYYLNELINRQQETEHLASFQFFIEFTNSIKQLIKEHAALYKKRRKK